MADAIMEKFSAIGEKIKEGGSDLTRKMSASMNTVSEKMKELFQVSTEADKLVEDATAETLHGPDWSKNMDICDTVNTEQISGQDVVRAIKKRLALRVSKVQLLALALLETCVKNCEKMFSEVASEKILDEMVKAVDDPKTPTEVREKILRLIESWGESTEELRYLPVFEETMKSLKSRGVRFPPRDEESLAPIFTPPQSTPSLVESNTMVILEHENNNLSDFFTKEIFEVARNSADLLSTVLSSSPQQEVLKEELSSTLVQQCRQSQLSVQSIIERAGDNEPLLFEALSVNDELQNILSKYEELLRAPHMPSSQKSGPALIPITVGDDDDLGVGGGEDALVCNRPAKPSTARTMQGDDAAMADLDEMIFGKGGASGEHNSQGRTKKSNEDLISF